MASDSVSWGGVALRIVAAGVLVFATFNPEGQSYYHWAIAPLLRDAGSFGATKFLAGAVLLAGWVVYLQATRRSIGWMGRCSSPPSPAVSSGCSSSAGWSRPAAAGEWRMSRSSRCPWCSAWACPGPTSRVDCRDRPTPTWWNDRTPGAIWP
ncbi:MAG: hypothetical protein IPF98_18860 [Gemmatimonadetes bacterium]|nr:hypothetical protein [Gemmatimonadota bacterium]